jgi:serine/threonine protein kinase
MLYNSKIKVESLLGEGLNANVYKAVSHSKEFGVQHICALKVLKRKEDLNHFKKEFTALSKVSGRHLVKLHGWQKYKGKPGILLEFIDGVNLEELTSQFELSNKEANWIYHEVLEGLIELNSNGLHHGDLSPKNIMISKTGHIKLIDFGLTKWRTQQIEVTPEFADPRLIRGESPSFKHDLYSLNKIYKTLNLFKSTKKEELPPDTLISKILSLCTHNFETQTIVNLPQKKFNSLSLKSFSYALALITLLFPFSLTNVNSKPSTAFIRSSKWMSLKLPNSSEWCFTPCTLKFAHLGTNKVRWRSQNAEGETSVFLEHDGQTLFLENPSL